MKKKIQFSKTSVHNYLQSTTWRCFEKAKKFYNFAQKIWIFEDFLKEYLDQQKNPQQVFIDESLEKFLENANDNAGLVERIFVKLYEREKISE